MTTPNLDATGHQWVGALERFNFQLEYQEDWNNNVADALSWITTCLILEAVQSVLDGVTLGMAHRAEGHDPSVVEGDHNIEKEVHVTAGWVQVEMHMTDWAAAQKEDLVLYGDPEKTNLRALLEEHAYSEEGWMVWRYSQNFMTLQDALYLHSMPKGENEDLLLFVVLKAHLIATLNECPWDAGHQGCHHTLPLLQEHFWWLGMAKQMRQSIRACTYCLQYEGGFPKAPLCPIVAIAPLDLLHVDFTSNETMLEPNQSTRVTNVLVFQDHFMKHLLAYVTPIQITKNVAKCLFGVYISIFGVPARL